jgi:hypothetical protein
MRKIEEGGYELGIEWEWQAVGEFEWHDIIRDAPKYACGEEETAASFLQRPGGSQGY